MPATAKVVRQRRQRRHRALRRRIVGTSERPRLSVFRSSAHIHVQVIDDGRSETLVAASTLEASAREGKKVDRARTVGELVARRALEKGIRRVVFDRGGYLYHGRIKAVAEGARSGGLEF